MRTFLTLYLTLVLGFLSIQDTEARTCIDEGKCEGEYCIHLDEGLLSERQIVNCSTNNTDAMKEDFVCAKLITTDKAYSGTRLHMEQRGCLEREKGCDALVTMIKTEANATTDPNFDVQCYFCDTDNCNGLSLPTNESPQSTKGSTKIYSKSTRSKSTKGLGSIGLVMMMTAASIIILGV